MILDEQTKFSDNQQISATSASSNIIKFGTHEMAFGTPVQIFVQVTQDFDKLTNLQISLQTSIDEAFTSPVTLVSDTVPLANLKKGYESTINFLPKGNIGYLRMYYTVTGTAPDNGKISAFLCENREESFHNS